MTELRSRSAPLGQLPRAVIPRLRASRSLKVRIVVRSARNARCGGCGKRNSDTPEHEATESERLASALTRCHPDVIIRTDSQALDRESAELLADSGAPVITTAAVDRPYMTLGPQKGLVEPAAVVMLSEFGR